ncbi:MAG TPA: serine hydrolase [Vicinamibacterales bacterium]|nr:serine hydrolase [Vicinamibacterales bacterium]
MLGTACVALTVGAGLASAQTAAKPASSTSKTSTAVKKPAATTSSKTSVARAQAASRARAAAASRQQQDAMTAHFKRDLLGNLVPDVRAAAAIVYNPATGEVIWEENSHEERSIASLTKLMTAVTFVADDPDLTQRVAVTRADLYGASTTYLRAGELLSYDDLLHLALIASDNAAARVLARTSEGGTAAFVVRMNEMAGHLGLSNTHYADPSGLNPDNTSSAYDLSHLISFASSDERLSPILRTAEYDVHTSQRTIPIHTTNRLLGTDVDVRAAKTGFISKAGYCLATLLQVPQGSQIAVVVLGAANSTTRFWEARHLFNWVVSRSQGIVGGDPVRKPSDK